MINKTGPKFRFLCFGVGAVGIYLGGSLVKIGHHVTFIDRPENVEGVRQKGLHLIILNIDLILPFSTPNLLIASIAYSEQVG